MNNEVIKKLQIKNGKLQIQIERLKLDKEEYYLDYLDLQQRIDKAIEWIDEHVETYTQNEISIIDWNTTSDPRQLKKILKGEDNE